MQMKSEQSSQVKIDPFFYDLRFQYTIGSEEVWVRSEISEWADALHSAVRTLFLASKAEKFKFF